MTKKAQGKMTRITITVPEDLLESFKKYCDKQFRPLSTQLQFMMSEAIEASKNNDESTP